jgi:hypothetical protein
MARKREPDNLDKDSARATAAGMSYGKWKSDHTHTKDDDVFIRPKTKPCGICGSDMPMRGRAKKYCCEECAYQAKQMRDKEHRQRQKENNKEEA